MLLLAQHSGISIEEVPVTWQEVGGSKVSLAVDSVRMLVDLVIVRVCYWLGVWEFPVKGEEKKE